MCSHLSGRRVAAPLDAAYPGLAPPTRGWSTCGGGQPPVVHRRLRPCLALLPAGVTWPSALRQMPVVSYTTFSPSPRARRCGAVCFCGPLPAGSRLSAASPPRLLTDAVPYGVRTFLDPVNAEPRLPDQPESKTSYTLAVAASTFAHMPNPKAFGLCVKSIRVCVLLLHLGYT